MRGVHKLETQLPCADLKIFKQQFLLMIKVPLFNTLHNSIILYKQLRSELYNDGINYQTKTEQAVLTCFTASEQTRIGLNIAIICHEEK